MHLFASVRVLLLRLRRQLEKLVYDVTNIFHLRDQINRKRTKNDQQSHICVKLANATCQYNCCYIDRVYYPE